VNRAYHPKYKNFVYLLTAIVFIGTNLIALFIFDRTPHIHDEAAYDFQAKIFLLGRLYVPSPCAKEFFDFPHVINNGRWYSQYPPGFPALLAIGYIFKAPWVINPLFAALTIILIFYLGTELFDEKTGFWAALFASLSYWFLILSSTLMSHTTHLFFCTLFLLFYIRAWRNPSLKNGFISGFGFFMAFLIRPYESVLFAVAPAIYLLFVFIKEPKKYYKATLALALMALLAAGALMAYNYGTTGHPLKMGYIERYGPDHGVGFGKKGYTGVPHTFLRGANYAWANLVQLHLHLFGWPISSLLGVIIYLFFLIKEFPKHCSDPLKLLLLFIILSTFFGLIFYWDSFPILGARMCFHLFSILSFLTAAGFIKLIKELSLFKISSIKPIPIFLFIFFIFISYAFMFRLPAFSKQSFEAFIPDLIYPDFISFNKRFADTISSLGIKNAVILLKPLYLARPFFPDSGWTAGFIQNDPLLKNKLIFAHFKPDNIKNLVSCFPEKKLYLFVYTIKKAMVFELTFPVNELTPKLNLIPLPFIPNKIELIKQNKEFFSYYSSEFQEFLKELDSISPLYFDLGFLVKLAEKEEATRNYRKALMYYEAALQLEPHPQNRQDLYKKLSACYFKIGETSLAKKIIDNIYKTPEPVVNNIIPKRGI